MNYSNLTKLFLALNEIDFNDLSEIEHDTKDSILTMIEALQEEVEGVLLSDSKENLEAVIGSVKQR
ncbi:hypothetical protein [Marinomonas shanghaiensis]|uniref:hypothetical protein n=1 Tax=Marinomonas shanghaiensis TaxID=2202418 RepID=UPI003A8F8BCD